MSRLAVVGDLLDTPTRLAARVETELVINLREAEPFLEVMSLESASEG